MTWLSDWAHEIIEGGASLIASVILAAIAALVSGPAVAYYCMDNESIISCSTIGQDNGATRCFTNTPGECVDLGFTHKCGDEFVVPVAAGPLCTVASVPELEDYAAATFLVLTLTIGWQVRRRQLSI
jgi:hypothetical protein